MIDKKRIIRTLLLIMGVFMILQPLTAEERHREEIPIIQPLAEQVSAEILPRIELLSGALSQTSWMQDRGPT